MMRLDDLWNVVTYELWERRGSKLARALALRWETVRARLQRPETDETPPRRADDRRLRMEVEQAAQEALAKAMLDKMSRENVDIIKAAVRQEVMEEAHEQAIAVARAELEEEFQRRREQLEDCVAQERARLEDESLGELDRLRGRQRQEPRDGFEEQISTLTDERDELRQRCEQAEAMLVSLLRQFLPEGRKHYLFSGAAGVRDLDRWTLNQVLARHGLVLKSRSTYSERLVATRLEPDRVAGHTQFWLERSLPPGVVDEDEPAADIPALPPVAAPPPEVRF